MLRFNWLGHQSRLDMALAAVCLSGGAWAPITGHLLISSMFLLGVVCASNAEPLRASAASQTELVLRMSRLV